MLIQDNAARNVSLERNHPDGELGVCSLGNGQGARRGAGLDRVGLLAVGTEWRPEGYQYRSGVTPGEAVWCCDLCLK